MARSPYRFSALVEILLRATLSSAEEVVLEVAGKGRSARMVAGHLLFPLGDTLSEFVPKARLPVRR